MRHDLKIRLNALGINTDNRSIDSIRYDIEDLLEQSLSNNSFGESQMEEDLIISKEENNLCHDVINTYSDFMHYYELQLINQLNLQL